MNYPLTNSSAAPTNSAQLSEYLELLQAIKRKQDRNKLTSYQPYPKQREFHRNGALFNERLFMAGNQLGKTLAGGAEVAIHLTGNYPDWWDGLVFDEPPLIWASGVTSETTRDNPQRVLMGPPANENEWGTGFIPYDHIKDTTRAVGVPNLLDNAQVKHKNGTSQVSFKAYEKGRLKWQGPVVHLVWFDEEPPQDIYSEGKTRTNTKGVHTMITATPLLGMTEVIRGFLNE